MEKSAHLVKGESLFINSKTGAPLRSTTISKLIVGLINEACPDVLPHAHDVRKVAASLAWARGVSPEEIVKAAFWSSSSVFISRYLINPSSTAVNCRALV